MEFGKPGILGMDVITSSQVAFVEESLALKELELIKSLTPARVERVD